MIGQIELISDMAASFEEPGFILTNEKSTYG